MSKALACCGTQFPSRFGGELGCFCTALFRPPGTLRSRNLCTGCHTHLSTLTWSSSTLGSRSKKPGKLTLEGFDFVFNVSRTAQLTGR